ncbi:hypothetical protein HDZ31DRAFT_81840 [Schizophyllum fasciatum]
MAAQVPRKISIAVIGGGIGGLALVLAIQRFCDLSKLTINVYESASQISQIGAGINIWERVYHMLEKLGLEADISSLLNEGQNMSWFCRKSDQPEGVPMRTIIFKEAGRMLLLHRADVQDVFLKHISPEVKIHLSHRLESFSHTEDVIEKIKLKFKDGKEARCDLLVGADGVHSVVRRQLLPYLADKLTRPELRESAEAVFSGSKVYRDLVPAEELAKAWPGHPVLGKPHIYCGKGKHVVTYPISQGRFINVVPFYTDLSLEYAPFKGSQIGQATTKEILENFSEWEPEVRALLGCMQRPSHWSVLTLKPFDTWAADGVVLIGDAAHAMTPHVGAGACEAIEDGYVLAQILARAQRKDPFEILSDETMSLYNRLRTPIGNFVQARARLQVRFYEFDEEGGDFSLLDKDSPVLRERDRLLKLSLGIEDGYMWHQHKVICETDAAVEQALSSL